MSAGLLTSRLNERNMSRRECVSDTYQSVGDHTQSDSQAGGGGDREAARRKFAARHYVPYSKQPVLVRRYAICFFWNLGMQMIQQPDKNRSSYAHRQVRLNHPIRQTSRRFGTRIRSAIRKATPPVIDTVGGGPRGPLHPSRQRRRTVQSWLSGRPARPARGLASRSASLRRTVMRAMAVRRNRTE
jgi:hypothetical protein